MIELDTRLILWSLLSIFFWAFAFACLIGAIRREVYINYQKKVGIKAIVWGLGTFLLCVIVGSLPLLLFNDYGYSREIITGLSIAVLVISFPFGFLLEKQLRVLNSKKEQISNNTTLDSYIGVGIWRVISLCIVVGVLVFARPFIITWVNDVLFIKESVFVEKIPLNKTLDALSHYEAIQNDFLKYTKANNSKNLIQLSFAAYFLSLTKYDKGLRYIHRIINKDSQYLPALIIYGDYFLKRDELNKATEQYQLAARIDENDPSVNASLCWVNAKYELEKAFDFCQKALRSKPNYGLAYGYLIYIYNQKGQYQQAIDAYHKALRYGANKGFVHKYAAVAYQGLNKLDDARLAINKSLDLDPKNMDAYILNAQIGYLQGNKTKAIEGLERVASRYPKEVKVLGFLGILYTNEHRFNEAIQIYQQALNVTDDKIEKAMIYENLGLTYYENNQFELAVEAFEKAKEFDQGRSTIYINLGAAFIKLNKFKEAEKSLDVALKLDPKDGLAHNNMGDVLAQEGKIKEAIVEFQKALDIDPDLKIAKENLIIYQKKE